MTIVVKEERGLSSADKVEFIRGGRQNLIVNRLKYSSVVLEQLH